MEKKHQDWIQKNFTEILKHTNLEILLQHVKRKNIFPEILLEKYQLPTVTLHERKRQFYWDIQKRGPKAYGLLLEACQESGQYTLYTILNGEPFIPQPVDILKNAKPFGHEMLSKTDNRDNIYNTLLEENTGVTLSLDQQPTKIVVKTSEERMDIANGLQHKSLTPYSMHGTKRGIAFVINNIEFMGTKHKKREGAEVDAKNLKELFKQLGYEWIYWENQTYKDIHTKLRDFTQDTDNKLREVDSCFIIFMSHGVEGHIPEDTHIVTYDNLEYKTSEIINKFSNSSCKSLRNKPKILIFQACRGNMEDFGVKYKLSPKASRRVISPQSPINKTQADGESYETMPNKSDMLICYASSPGYRAYRDTLLGSWFIQYLCEIFMNYAYNTDVQKLFTMISGEVTEKRTQDDARQSAYIATYGFRPCFLNPGLEISSPEKLHF